MFGEDNILDKEDDPYDILGGEELNDLDITKKSSSTEPVEFEREHIEEEDDEDEEDEHDAEMQARFQHPRESGFTVLRPTKSYVKVSPQISLNLSEYMYLLGRSYHLIHDAAARRSEEENLLYFSYRSDFPEILPYGYTSDAGWGCMLRASQMMLAQALKVHYRGRQWTNFARGWTCIHPFAAIRSSSSSNHSARRDEAFYADLLTWFADHPGFDTCFSLHNMVTVGFKYEKLPGEWYGPGTVCHVMRDLCYIYEQQQYRRRLAHLMNLHKQNRDEYPPEIVFQDFVDADIFRVFVANEGAVYRDAIEQAMTQDGRQDEEEDSLLSKSQQQEPTVDKPTVARNKKEVVLCDPLLNPQNSSKPLHNFDATTASTGSSAHQLEWDRALLLLVPLRLGLQRFQKDVYATLLARTFGLSQSVGFLGGSPRHALWFYGANASGSKVYGFDPHTVQTAPIRDPSRYGVVNLSQEYQQSVICSNPVEMDMGRIDPSLALGFYCRDRSDFESLLTSLSNLRKPGEPELFSVLETSPNYGNEDLVNDQHILAASSGTLAEDDDDAVRRCCCINDSFDHDDLAAPNSAPSIIKQGPTQYIGSSANSDEDEGEEEDEYVFL